MTKEAPVLVTVQVERGVEHLARTLEPIVNQGLPVILLDNTPYYSDRHFIDELRADRSNGVDVVDTRGQRRGGSRAQIIGSRTLQLLGRHNQDPIVLSVDNGIEVTDVEALPFLLRDALSMQGVAIVGGRVFKDGRPFPHNWGPNICSKPPLGMLNAYATAGIIWGIEQLDAHNPVIASRWRNRLNFMLGAWPNAYDIPLPKEDILKQVGWAYEGFSAYRASTLEIANFQNINVHEGQVLARELSRRGLFTYIHPRMRAIQTTSEPLSGVLPHSPEGFKTAAKIALHYAFANRGGSLIHSNLDT